MCLLSQRSNSKNTEVKYITKLRINTGNDSRDNTGEVKEKFSAWKMASCSECAAWQKIWKDHRWHEDHGSSRNEKAEVRKMAEAEIYAKHWRLLQTRSWIKERSKDLRDKGNA